MLGRVEPAQRVAWPHLLAAKRHDHQNSGRRVVHAVGVVPVSEQPDGQLVSPLTVVEHDQRWAIGLPEAVEQFRQRADRAQLAVLLALRAR